MQKGVIFPTLFLIHKCTSTANILIMLNATKKARENQDSKKDLVQHVLITVLVHYLTRHGSSKIFFSLVFIFHTCRMCCEVNNRLSSRQMWDKSGPTSNGDKPCHAGTAIKISLCLKLMTVMWNVSKRSADVERTKYGKNDVSYWTKIGFPLPKTSLTMPSTPTSIWTGNFLTW